MSRRRRFLTSLGVVFGLGVVFRLFFLPDVLTRQMVVTPPGDSRTPEEVGLPFEDVSFDVDGDRLVAWYVEPPTPKPVAFLLLHGDGETVSDWLPVLRLLHDAGYSSLIYDFAGYGNSEGRPTTRIFSEEPRRALDQLLMRTGPGTLVSVIGHSFGAAVAVEAFHGSEEQSLHSLVFNAGPPALRDILHEIVGVPRPVTLLLPNLVNAKENIAEVNVPVLVIGSSGDELFSPEMTRRVYDGARDPKEWLLHESAGHNALTAASPEWWRPLLEWVEGV